MKSIIYKAGIDIGSTTAKAAIIDSCNQTVFSDYKRHYGNIKESLLEICLAARKELGNVSLNLAITGSAGMGISEKSNIPFVQEVLAAAEFTSVFYPDIKTLIDIGGEDSKIIFFNEESGQDIRMNGSCAGGTGAFIDQMAALLNISVEKLDELALSSTDIYPIASRCGVFAKTDVQNLLSREIPAPDIAASIFHAVAIQIKNSLLHGSDAVPKIIFAGGPLTFLPALKNAVSKIFEFNENDLYHIKNPELLTAYGAAISGGFERLTIDIDSLINKLHSPDNNKKTYLNGIPPLFSNNKELFNWSEGKRKIKAKRTSLKSLDRKECFIGIDSGSTTTKIVLIDENGNIAFDFYKNNAGNPIGVVKEGLKKLSAIIAKQNINLKFTSSAVTGYGEDLIRSAFDFDFGIVETIAHYRAAKVFDEKVTFILDIGGQDMKAIFVKNGIIQNIEVNEACSSGCGSFIETFAESLNYPVSKFSEIACSSLKPCDLGTRCTVFMNSKVKQSFREGASAADISAGLAYSVIQNCLHKVLKIFDNSLLGDNIIVQGGTFKNVAVLKAFENVLGKKVVNPDISELMGAYGAALTALDYYKQGRKLKGSIRSLDNLDSTGNYNIKYIHCKSCDNTCTVSKLNFGNGNVFNTGNRCEKFYSNNGRTIEKGVNIPSFKYDLLFKRKLTPEIPPLATLAIPRVLNFYENFPFWAKLLVECGIEIKLSDKSSDSLCELGSGTVMSDNICYPAKLVHGHILNLINSGAKRIFYPMVTFESNEFPETTNCFNCPVITGYPDVIRSSIGIENKYDVILDSPNINFKNKELLKKACYEYLIQFGIKKKDFTRAFKLALLEQENFRNAIRKKGIETITNARAEGKGLMVLSGRPYQIDPLINHGIPEMIADFGFDVLTEDCLPLEKIKNLDNLQVLSQWAYPNRLYKAAKWAGTQNDVEYVQLNSFGCGPDTIAMDELKDIIESFGKNFTLIRIDELTSTGSLRLRLRSLVESIRLRTNDYSDLIEEPKRITTKIFTKEDKRRTILVPFFSPFHSAYTSAPFAAMGYKVESLPPSDHESVELGLKYANNEICYPATLIIGDMLKALKSGKYKIDEIAVGISQTGGQCRASNYLSLIKKALVKNGFGDVPVVGISLSNKLLNNQPGFKIAKRKFTLLGIKGILFGDAISQMYHSTAPREVNKGESWEIAQKYNKAVNEGLEKNDFKYLLNKLSEAVAEFNNVEIINEKIPKIGVVGEIYVKYNPMGNQNIVNDLINRRIEVVLPPLINMFVQWLVNVNYKNKLNIEKKPAARKFAYFLEKYYNRVCRKFDEVMFNYRFNSPRHTIRDIAAQAEKVLNMSEHYFGEGWLIPGDILCFAEEGITNVLCLQPFGCIANHIVARGIEKSLKNLYPKLNLQFLDIDAGNSQVNLHNRIHLLTRKAIAEINQ